MVLLLSRNMLLLVVVFTLCVLLVNMVKHNIVQHIKLARGKLLFKHYILELFLKGISSSSTNMNPLFVVVFLILVVKNVLRRNIVVVQFSLMWLAVLLEHIINPFLRVSNTLRSKHVLE